MENYKATITKAMLKLAENPKTIFLGQQCNPESMYGTLDGIDLSRRLELPVAEELQTGIAIGLAMEGYLPVSIYQRMDFLLRATDQIVNHLSLMEDMTRDKFNPKVILRTTIGSHFPLDVGLQHNKDLTEGFKALVSFPVFKCQTVSELDGAYNYALNGKGSCLIIELQDLY